MSDNSDPQNLVGMPQIQTIGWKINLCIGCWILVQILDWINVILPLLSSLLFTTSTILNKGCTREFLYK